VQGKGKSRKLVAPKSVGEYLERIRVISKATEPNDRVFTNVTGKPANLNEANLREGTQGVPRSTYASGTRMPRSACRKAWTCISLPSRWELPST
jgi:hypothetical protein